MTDNLHAGPGAPASLAEYGRQLRSGAMTVVAHTRQLLDRIDDTQSRFQAFTHIDRAGALEQAARKDALLAQGTDLGPLMGVPVAIKDLFTVDGMPTRAGSRMDIQDLVPPEGPFIVSLRRHGCVFLGKTTTSEFALGGFNLTHPLPWNPCDMGERRMTSGSSHGSAVAMAAGLAGFTVGSDTGGSVRLPAALCGLVGYKSTRGYWPCEGVFPLSPALDSVGIFTRDARDAALVEAALAQRSGDAETRVHTLTLAVPGGHFARNVEAPVAACFAAACDRLRAAGARLVDIELPEAGEIDPVFAGMVTADLLAFLGKDRVARQGDRMDPVVLQRVSTAVDAGSDTYRRCLDRLQVLEHEIRGRLKGVDAWLSPTSPCMPGPVSDFKTVEQVAAWNRLSTQNTRPGNLFGHCGVSLPIHYLGAPLPVGLQICAVGGSDAALLGIAVAVEGALK
jgi:aspartyl-tRNA(Asn)/glutamyl-tRNA(Gln) amidotransferase subunit A